MSSAFVIWQDPGTTLWEPVAKLSESNGLYTLAYTRGALNKRFVPFPRMDSLNKTYLSNSLFPFFKNRLIPERRPEYYSMLSWLDMAPGVNDPIDVLSASGGAKKTDSFRIVKVPERTYAGEYRIKFFVSGIHYVSDQAKLEINALKSGDRLRCEIEPMNPADHNAVKIIRVGASRHLGYYPHYLNEDLIRLNKICGAPLPELFTKVSVLKVNYGAPEQYRLLCEAITPWPQDFQPFQSEKYQVVE